ncbi:hypothetical protein ml_32 [Mollivirus sibericum]|uniref:hypothetical protein n=1 Tax=Mollivirus sibericum TaxID=1678078 RepID=UPI0006B2DD82|nr:hypothetical protein ml_32 [Mollivirus sibericum]ALD61834.1 hypothetical protein ml_32 [Mollivirus sibericum]
MKRNTDSKYDPSLRKFRRSDDDGEEKEEESGETGLISAIFSSNFSSTVGARLVEFLSARCLVSLSSVSRNLRDNVLETARHVILSQHLSTLLDLPNRTSTTIRPRLGPEQSIGDFLANLSALARQIHGIPEASQEAFAHLASLIEDDEPLMDAGVFYVDDDQPSGSLKTSMIREYKGLGHDSCHKHNPVVAARDRLVRTFEQVIKTGSGTHVKLWLALHRGMVAKMHSNIHSHYYYQICEYQALCLPGIPASAMLLSGSVASDDHAIDVLTHCFSAYAEFPAYEPHNFDHQLQIVANVVTAIVADPDAMPNIAPGFVSRLVDWACGLRATLTRTVPINRHWLDLFRCLEDAMVAFATVNKDIAQTLADALLSLASWRSGAPDPKRFCWVILNTVDAVWLDNAQLLTRLQASLVGQSMIDFLKSVSSIFRDGPQRSSVGTEAFVWTSAKFINMLVKGRTEADDLDHLERQHIIHFIESIHTSTPKPAS